MSTHNLCFYGENYPLIITKYPPLLVYLQLPEFVCVLLHLLQIFSRTFFLYTSFRTDRSGQTVQTQIRLLLEEQSEQGLHCLRFRLHLLGELPFGKAILFKF